MDSSFANRSLGRPAFLVVLLIVSVATILVFPLFTVLYQYPKLEELLRDFTLSEAVGVARDLTSLLAPGDEPLDRGLFTP
jgi:hypothetical protein